MAKLDHVTIKGTTYEIVPEIAPLFNESTVYAVGDWVIKDAVLYRFTTAHAACAWNENQVEETTVGEELTGLAQSADDLKADLNDKASESTIATEFDESTSYTAGSYVLKNGVLYRFTSDHAAGAWTGTDAETVTVGGEINGFTDELNKKVSANISTEKDVNSATIINDDGSAKITSFVVSIKPTQGGSGTPSISNIREIVGVSEVNVFENEATIPISFAIAGNPTTLYDGSVDLVTGNVTVNGVLEIFTGANINDYSTAAGVPYARVTLSRLMKSGTWSQIKSNMFVSTNSNSDGSIYVPAYSSGNIRLLSTAFTSKAVAQSILNEHPVQIYYIPATAPTIHLDKKEITLLVGENVLSTDAGRFSISYVNTLKSYIDNEINSFDSYGLSTDATLYMDKLPSYYTEPETTPASFAGAVGYMDNKIAQIPKNGKSFIFVTDMHWDGNKKHSVDMISYICKRTGIRKVLFGGDIYGNASSKYEAMKKANSCMSKMKRAYGFNLISCVGDHDNNTVNVPSDAEHFLPYKQIEELFVDDLERYGEYHFYDASEKLANYAEVGSDDYNGAMAFFHTVYYVDDARDKIRYISLNCGCGGTYGAMKNIFGSAGSTLLRLQADWLADTLMSTPTGYDVIILSHKGNGSYVGTNAVVINSIIYGVKRKSSNVCPHPSTAGGSNIDSWWPNTTRYDFSKAPDLGLVIAVNGHSHADSLQFFGKLNGTYYSGNPAVSISSGSTIYQPDVVGSAVETLQIPIITTACDSLGAAESTSPVMTADTVTEQCFDVVTITDDAIIMTRFGAGDDRVLYLD